MIKDLDYAGYEKLLKNNIPAVIEFYSETCPHCKRTEAGLKELAKEQEQQVIFTKCNIESEPVLAQRLDVQSLPTLLFIQGGQIRNRRVGFTHKLIMQAEIDKLKEQNN